MKFIHVSEVNSTQDEARRLFAQAQGEPVCVRADTQRHGKGRAGRSWESQSKENLYMSLAVSTGSIKEFTPFLSLIAGLALYQTLIGEAQHAKNLEVAQRLFLKWPNDLMVKERADPTPKAWKKIGGILVEANSQSAIIGWGVNLKSAPHVEQPSADIRSEFGIYLDPKFFGEALSKHFLFLLKQLGIQTLSVRELLLTTELAMKPIFQQKGWVLDPPQLCVAEKLDLTHGHLVVKKADGQSFSVVAGDFKFLP